MKKLNFENQKGRVEGFVSFLKRGELVCFANPMVRYFECEFYININLYLFCNQMKKDSLLKEIIQAVGVS